MERIENSYIRLFRKTEACLEFKKYDKELSIQVNPINNLHTENQIQSTIHENKLLE